MGWHMYEEEGELSGEHRIRVHEKPCLAGNAIHVRMSSTTGEFTAILTYKMPLYEYLLPARVSLLPKAVFFKEDKGAAGMSQLDELNAKEQDLVRATV